MNATQPATLTVDELKQRLAGFPRLCLAHLPTPLEPMPRLSERLGGPALWVKRDDATGLAFGGNKPRQMEFRLGQALEQGADCVLVGAAVQSNFCRVTAAACAKLGLEAHLVLRKVPGQRTDYPQGNLLLDHVLGAQVELVEGTEEEQQARMRALAQELRAAGRTPYITGWTDVQVGALGYANAILEMLEQFEKLDLRPAAIVSSSGGCTQAGMLVATRALGLNLPVWSVYHGGHGPDARARVARVANGVADLLGLPLTFSADDVPAFNQYFAPAYPTPNDAGLDALRLTARTEGLLLDPVYTGKAMAGLIDQVRSGRWRRADNVVFVHTGGTPAIFAYADLLA
ncbi:MAG: D-cysteine desulfhydrase family protein [Chloroflexi bacterium]|nr:D-cysteine desulfhydrase family protein [Chloroflexota bacterium]